MQWTGALEHPGAASSPFDPSTIFSGGGGGGGGGMGPARGSSASAPYAPSPAQHPPPLARYPAQHAPSGAPGVLSLGPAPLPGAAHALSRPPPLSTVELQDQHSALAAARRARLQEGRASDPYYSASQQSGGGSSLRGHGLAGGQRAAAEYVSPTRLPNRPF